MAQEYGTKLDTFLILILDKIKIFEYHGCTWGIDKLEIYEDLSDVLHNMYRYYDDMRQSVIVDQCTFNNCLVPTTSVIERKLKQTQYDTSDLFPLLKHMYDQMNQLEDEGQNMYVTGNICVTCTVLFRNNLTKYEAILRASRVRSSFDLRLRQS